MKTRKKVKVSSPVVASCKTCGVSVSPLQLSWHRITCNGTNSFLNFKAPTNTILSSQPEFQSCFAATQSSPQHITNSVNVEKTGPMTCDPLLVKAKGKNPCDRKMEELKELEPTSGSVGFDSSEDLNAERCRSQVNEDDSDNLQNPTQGTHNAVCNCNEHDLIPYLRVAVERQDIEFVVQTLRAREAWFKGSEEIMRNAMQKLSRELDLVKTSEGEKLENLQRNYEVCLEREGECQMQYKELEEKYESLLFTHKQTQAQLEDLEKRCENLSQRERDAREKLEGFMEISKEAFKELNEARIKVRELESKCRDEMVKNKEKMKDNEALNSHMVMFGECETPKASQIEPISNTPCINSSMPKTLDNGIEAAEERGNRSKRVLFSSKEDSYVRGNLDITSPGYTEQLGEKKIDIGSRVWPTHVVNLLGHLSPTKAAESQLEKESFKTVISDNPASKQLIADAIKIDESGNDEKEGNIVADLRAKENGTTDCMDIVIFDRNDEPLTTLGSSSCPSMDKCSRDGLLGNKRSFPVTKSDLQGSVKLLRVDPIVISDTDSESSGNLIAEIPFIPNNQTTRAEIGSWSNFMGYDTVREHSDHSEEQLLQRSAKTRRRLPAAVISDSESNSSEAAFSCKRRKSQPFSLETQSAHASEGIELNKQGYVTCKRGIDLGDSYCATFKEDEAVSSVCEPYEPIGSDKDMQEEVLLSNEEAQGVQFRRLRRMKEDNVVELCKKQPYSVGGEYVSITKFKRLQGMIETNELPSPAHPEEGLHSIDRGECSYVTKFKRLKRVGKSNGPEQSKVGETFTCLQEQNTSVPDVNPTVSSRNVQCRASIHGRSPDTANKKGTAGNAKHVEVSSGPLLNKLNCRSQRNLSRKTIILSKSSDNDSEEGEDESNSEGDDLNGFIVDDDSESETNAESSSELKGNNSNISDSENSARNWNSQSESDPNSSMDLNEILKKMRGKSKNILNWEYEADMLAAFAKDPLLCMRAICALYRQQTNEEKCGKSSLYQNRRGFDKLHALRGSLLAEFLTENDPLGPMKKSVQELEKHNPKDVQFCRDLAIHHSKQLFEIYKDSEDPHFPQK